MENKETLIKILSCLIKANKDGTITDTLWFDNFTTLFDFIAIEADLTEEEYNKLLESEEINENN